MMKIRRDQAEKPIHERIDNNHVKMRLGSGLSKNTRQKSRTPSTEILSDEYSRAEPRNETQTISPKSTSMLTKNWKKTTLEEPRPKGSQSPRGRRRSRIRRTVQLGVRRR